VKGYFHQGPRVPDPASPDGRCTHCGHAVPSTCTVCDREMICGEVGEPCTTEDCQEKRLRNPEHDLRTCTPEEPRMARKETT
jgi:hypothetical protein